MLKKRNLHLNLPFEFSRWWFIVSIIALSVAAIYLSLWKWGKLEISQGYKLAELLKDGADISLKVGALVGGILAVYKYLYKRYEPIVYYASCGLIPFSLIKHLSESNRDFIRISRIERCSFDRHDFVLQRCHDLPMIVLHQSDMITLGLKEGSQVDLEFTNPDGKIIWAIAYVFSFESTGKKKYHDWPIGISLSLRRFFRMERPFQSQSKDESKVKIPVPKGWKVVEHNAADLAILHQTYRKGKTLIWIVPEEYSVRFRDRKDSSKFFSIDSFEDQGRIMEYVGISLRILSRGWFRYRASS